MNQTARLISEILSTEGYFSPQIEFAEVDGDLRIDVDLARAP